jgi:hypothetical protein
MMPVDELAVVFGWPPSKVMEFAGPAEMRTVRTSDLIPLH